MKYWRFSVLIMLLLIILVGSGVYFFIQTRNYALSEKIIDSKNFIKPVFYNYKQTIYFAPVVGVKSYVQNINSATLIGQKIAILESDEFYLKELLGSMKIEFVLYQTFDELSAFLNSNLSALGILNFSELNFRVKTLSYDNIFLLDKKSDLSKYNLKIEKILISQIQKEDKANLTQSELRNIGHTGSMISARGIEIILRRKFGADFTRPFQNTKPLFDSIDFVSSTFEAPVLGEGRPCDACFTFVGPDKFMEGVAYSGIDFYTMATNHIMDGGIPALKNTQEKLDKLGIKYTGASTVNNDDAGKPVLIEVNGLKIAYLGFNDTPGRGQWADENSPGAASISDWDIDSAGRTIRYEPNEERIKYFIQRAKSLNPDLTIVLMHWGGVEYEAQPTSYTRKLAQLLMKNGADIIFGDHPHWVQEIEYIDGKPVFYSVGNFIFDQMWSIETRQGMTIELNLYKNKVLNFKLHPHQLDLYDNGTVQLLKPEQTEYKQTLDRVFRVSNLN